MQQMEWGRLLSQKRIGADCVTNTASKGRSAFQVDVDRVIFSSTFRRLGRKTQVHPLPPNDHIHNRLSHSLEVARVGAALGQALGYSPKVSLPSGVQPHDLGAIVHAACLAHDIGNPPFGHAGESAIVNWFTSYGRTALEGTALDQLHQSDLFHYEGNAQGFRILTQTDNHLFAGGLRLTAATLGAFLKYPWTIEENETKFGAFLSEKHILQGVAEECGLIRSSDHAWRRHPLAFLLEAADDICYGITDLEDAVELRIVTFDEVFAVLTKSLTSKKKNSIRATFAGPDAYRVNLARLRGAIFDEIVGGAIEAFETVYDDIMTGQFEGDLFSALPPNDSRRCIVGSAKELAKKKIYRDTKKVEIELGCSSTFGCLLDTFCRAARRCAPHLSDKAHTSIDWKSELVLRLLGDHSPLVAKPPDGESWNEYQCIRRVLDYVGGMTDNYAVYVAQQIQGASFSGGQRP